MAQILKKFSFVTRRLKLDHLGLKVYKININGEPWFFTLTYLTAKVDLVKNAYCAYTMPRCQVSVYRSIGPLAILVNIVYTVADNFLLFSYLITHWTSNKSCYFNETSFFSSYTIFRENVCENFMCLFYSWGGFNEIAYYTSSNDIL